MNYCRVSCIAEFCKFYSNLLRKGKNWGRIFCCVSVEHYRGPNHLPLPVLLFYLQNSILFLKRLVFMPQKYEYQKVKALYKFYTSVHLGKHPQNKAWQFGYNILGAGEAVFCYADARAVYLRLHLRKISIRPVLKTSNLPIFTRTYQTGFAQSKNYLAKDWPYKNTLVVLSRRYVCRACAQQYTATTKVWDCAISHALYCGKIPSAWKHIVFL